MIYFYRSKLLKYEKTVLRNWRIKNGRSENC
jgi:hypothetical protein